MSSVKTIKINKLDSSAKQTMKYNHQKQKDLFKYRTLNLGSYKMFFTLENNELIYKFI